MTSRFLLLLGVFLLLASPMGLLFDGLRLYIVFNPTAATIRLRKRFPSLIFEVAGYSAKKVFELLPISRSRRTLN